MDDRSPHDSARDPEMTLPLDDEQLGRLVRAAVDDWKLPPQRLDGFTWRDRVAVAPRRVRPARLRAGAGGTVAAPLAAAALLTVFALVATSVGVAWLNARPAPAGASATPGGGTPGSEATTAPERLPEFEVSGAPLPTGSLLVQDEGVVRLLDLATGEEIASLANPWPEGTSYIYDLPEGGYVFVRVASQQRWGSQEQAVSVTVHLLDAAFREQRVIEAGPYAGFVDPSLDAEGPYGASALPTVDPAGRHAFIGWSRRTPEGWESGVDVIDLARWRVVQGIDLPAVRGLVGRAQSAVPEVFAPVVRVQPGGSLISIARSARDWTGTQGPGSELPDQEERWWLVLEDGRFGDPVAWSDAAQGPDEACRRILDEGFAGETSYYLLCEDPPGDLEVAAFPGRYTVRIIDLAEGGRHDVPLDGMVPDDGAVGTATQRSTLWVWQASGAIAEVDLVNWVARTMPDIGPVQSGSTSPLLRQLGELLVPAASAKPWHERGWASPRLLVPSADGSTLFALRPTIWDQGSGDVSAPPAVVRIDTATLQAIDVWPGLAAWESLLLSPDGRFLLLGAPAGLDANGRPDVSWKASIVALDTSSGEARLILGREGEGGLMVGTDPLG
jgi:hypothetical protein